MNPLETMVTHDAEVETPAEEPAQAMPFDPATEELLIAQSDIEGRKRLLSTYLIQGYLRGDFDLDLSNPVHHGIHETLREQGLVREPKFVIPQIKSADQASEA